MSTHDLKDATPETAEGMIEEGVALIARGLFRIGDASGRGDPAAAFTYGMVAVSTIRDMAFDFLRNVD